MKDLIYAATQFSPLHPPRTHYIPSKEIMIKMMRVCVECKDPFELWYIF